MNENKYFNATYNELIIQDGDFQVLVTGGLYGDANGLINGFLGTSVPFTFDHSNAILYTPIQAVKNDSCHRYLIDYYKNGANIRGGFVSQRFKDSNFEAAHP